MGRVVYQDIELTVTADATQDVWSVFAAAAQRVKMLGWELTSEDTSAELILLKFRRITAVGSVGTSSTTEELADETFGAVTANVRTLDTTPGTGGGNLMSYAWEQLGPVGHVWTPEMAPISAVSEGFSLLWESATSANVRGYICWEEL